MEKGLTTAVTVLETVEHLHRNVTVWHFYTFKICALLHLNKLGHTAY